jgi:glycogen synthase
MHILITADTVGGVWTYSKELATGLLRQGARVTLVSFGNLPSLGQTEWIEQLPEPDSARLAYFPTAFKLEWMQDSAADLEASAEFLLGVIRETEPDLLHLNQFYYGALECDLPRLVVAHSDVVSWWWVVHGQAPPPSPWMSWYREVVARGLQHATAVIAPSRWMLAEVERRYGRLRRGLTVHNGRSPWLFNPHRTKDTSIVTVGRLWDAGKNAALILREPMPAPVCIAGSESHPQAKGKSFSRGSSGVRLESHMSERRIVELFSRAGIYAALSQYEPFGLAPVEAALSRCAIVASDIPSFRELWQDAALFFRNNDSADLRRVLEALVSDPKLRNTYARLAYEHALRHFHARRMVDEYMELYRTLAPVSAAA